VQPLPDARDQEIAELRALLAAALRRIAELESRLNQNSSNSSKPPSSDPPEAPRQGKPPTGRKPGGQPGHKQNKRERLTPTRVEVVKPKRCPCGGKLQGDDAAPLIHQVIEIPPIQPSVVEYQLHALTCPDCRKRTRAKLPPGVPTRGFGAMLIAMVALLTGKYRLSKRMVEELLSDMLNVELCVGSVCNLEQEMSAALETPVVEAMAFVKTAPVANLDETGWYEGQEGGRAGRAWLWTAVTPLVAVFLISKSRGAAVAKALLGADFAGLMGTDRWSSYNWLPTLQRQLCWSHLMRDFQSFVDRGGEGGVIGAQLLERAQPMFGWWHRVRDKTLSRDVYETWMTCMESDVLRLLREAEACPDADTKTAGMAREILKLKDALFTFVRNPLLEPTNNVAERAIRPAVMWRKTSFGTHSAEGSRYVERVLTTCATLKKQRRSMLPFLAEAYQAWLSKKSPPSLLPTAAVS
jgi:transposase